MAIKIVRFDTDDWIACAFTFFGYRRIYTSNRFEQLPLSMQMAALVHEEAHCKYWHTEIRLLFLILMPLLFKWICHRQEFQADRYAVRMGHLAGMLSLLSVDCEESILAPSNAQRRKKITLALHTSRATSMGSA